MKIYQVFFGSCESIKNTKEAFEAEAMECESGIDGD